MRWFWDITGGRLPPTAFKNSNDARRDPKKPDKKEKIAAIGFHNNFGVFGKI